MGGGVLIERFTAFKNRAGLFAKNVYNYKNPYMADCKDGRSCDRYTVRDSTFIGNDVAVLSINGSSKIHVEESLIAPNLPVDLYPEAEGDAVLTQRYMTEGDYRMGKEGKHLPKQKDLWSLTFDDATLEAAKEYGYKTYAEIGKLIRAGKWSSRGGMSVGPTRRLQPRLPQQQVRRPRQGWPRLPPRRCGVHEARVKIKRFLFRDSIDAIDRKKQSIPYSLAALGNCLYRRRSNK